MKVPAIPYLLLAEDDPDDREMIEEGFLRRNPGASIYHLEDGQQVLEWLEQCPPAGLPAILLLDYKMPIITGAQILAALERDVRYKDIPKVVWSTSSNQSYMDECMRHGALRYWVKPDDTRQMDEILSYLTGLFRARTGGN